MKKSILVTASVLITITAFGFIKWNSNTTNESVMNCTATNDNKPDEPLPFYIPKPADLYYDLGSRFGPITKSTLHQANSIRDFFTDDVNKDIFSIKSANIIIIVNDEHSDIQVANDGEKLSPAQLKLLGSCNYSTHIKISTDVKTKKGSGYYSPHLTVVPEKQAAYSQGMDAFISYLKVGNKKNVYNLNNEKLGFAKLYFTINKDGRITNLNLDHSCGYEKIDNAIIELLNNAPGKWTPAENEQCEKVEQELVISFGKGGC